MRLLLPTHSLPSSEVCEIDNDGHHTTANEIGADDCSGCQFLSPKTVSIRWYILVLPGLPKLQPRRTDGGVDFPRNAMTHQIRVMCNG